MTPKEISKMIEKEINGYWSISNAHSCDLKKCLVRPKRRKLQFTGGVKEFWIVLEEYPETLEGYKVFFDAEVRKFGLAGNSEPIGYVCNYHDTFLAAYQSM
jgi:hypothetical protein